MGQLRRYYRGDFTLDITFTTEQNGTKVEASVPNHIKIDYYTDDQWKPYTVERNGNVCTNCKVSDKKLVAHLSLAEHPIGVGLLRYIITEYTQDASYPGGTRKKVTPGQTDIILWTGRDSEDMGGIEHGTAGSVVLIEDIVDNLYSNTSSQPLSAAQGKKLNDNKVDKIYGKGLSTNDYTTADKAVVDRLRTFDPENISIEGGASVLVETTYLELRDKRDAGLLTPGVFYRITDYETTTAQADTRSAEHPFDIIVQALDECTLSENAQAIQRDGDTYFADAKLEAWKLKYSIDNDTSRFSWVAAGVEERTAKWTCGWGTLEERNDTGASSNYEIAPVGGSQRYLYRPTTPTSYLNGKRFYRTVIINSVTLHEDLIYEAEGFITISNSTDWSSIESIEVQTPDGTSILTLYREDGSTFYESSDYEEDMNYPLYFDGDVEYHEDGYYRFDKPNGFDGLWEDLDDKPDVSIDDLVFITYSDVYTETSVSAPSEIVVRTKDGETVTTFVRDEEATYYDIEDSMQEYGIRFGSSYTETADADIYHLEPEPEGGIDDWWEYYMGGAFNITDKVYYNGPVSSLYYAFGSALNKSTTQVRSVTDKEYLYTSDSVIDTVTYESYIAPQKASKGIIYRMIDERNNDCPFDFKNIQFKHNNEWYYPFSYKGEDFSLSDYCSDNYVEPIRNIGVANVSTTFAIPKLIFNLIDYSGKFQKGIVNNNIRAAIETGYIEANRITDNEWRPIASGGDGKISKFVCYLTRLFYGNRFYGENKEIYIGEYTKPMVHFFGNELDLYMAYGGVLKISCSNFTANVYKSRIGGSGSRTISGGYFRCCIIEDVEETSSTQNVTFDAELAITNSRIRLKEGLTITYANTTSSSAPLRNLDIDARSWSGTIDIPSTFKVNATYELKVAKNSSEAIKMWCDADLVQ